MTKVIFKIGGKIVEMEKELVSGAIETGEIEINTDNLVILDKSEDNVVYTKSEFEAYNNNFGKSKYNEGKTAGEEIFNKKLKEIEGLEFEGKSTDKAIEALKAKIIADAKIEPNTKITELTGDITKLQTNYATLQTNYATLQTELDTYKSTVTQEKTRARKDNDLLSYLPKTGLVVNNDITLVALKAQGGIDIDYNEAGKAVVTVKGEIQKDSKTMEPIDPATFIGDKLKALGLLAKPEGGTGETDQTGGGKATDYDKFVKEMETLNIREGSRAFSEEMTKRISAKTLTV